MKRRIFQGNKAERQTIYDRLILLVLFILLLIMARAVWRLWQKNDMAQKNLLVSAEHLRQLEERKEALDLKMTKLKTSRGVEEEIRVNFSVVKPGEKVINLVEPDKPTTTASTTPVRHWWQIF